MAKIKYVIKRNGATVAFSRSRIVNAIFRAAVSVGGRDKKTAENLADEVIAVLEEKCKPQQYPTVEEVQDVVEKTLIEAGHAKVAKHYILYREERTRRRQKEKPLSEQRSEYIPWAKMWRTLDWAVSHNLNTVEQLNQRIENGEIKEIVAESEAAYAGDINTVSALLEERKDEVRLAIVAGPSSSGKTTTTNKIAHHLGKIGMQFVELNLDNYYFDLEMHPKDEFGDYDFETPQALDIELINQHLHQLLEGKEVLLPFYDFKTGKRHPDQTPLRLRKGDIILIDSLYGLYPPLTDGITDNKVRLYIEPLLQLKDAQGKYVRWTDIRLMRRMLRDQQHRAYDYEKTLTHWHYVRSSEMRNIIPYSGSADFIINSAMPYELALYKPKLLDSFAQWVERYKNDPLRQDAFERATRIFNLLQTIEPYPDDSIVPPDSVIREFIGGLKID
ncbi:MAG: response regulator SirA [Anaerolineae bacterium]|jgi:uridine kinase|nr:response regulator SirA [Anaerolineae bacterium]MBT3714093.1 response regulator SirA [Anaerolineae bacterium]MBT4309225.1 response regulator SirA [Anaerolineae bacterium]MBT4459313.1 response regulator SirA [Anaerolineae bacterium]MBT4841191.1 response regulator SirA [Anaerolineae bacterium]